MADEIWCTYVTHHPSKFYYLGKSSLRRIEAGYKGSGPRLHCAMLHPGFEASTWTTLVLETYPTETIAFLAEERLIPLELLSDPFCLNSVPGGQRRHYGSPYSKILKLHAVKRTKKNVAAKVRPMKVTTKTLTIADLLGKKT